MLESWFLLLPHHSLSWPLASICPCHISTCVPPSGTILHAFPPSESPCYCLMDHPAIATLPRVLCRHLPPPLHTAATILGLYTLHLTRPLPDKAGTAPNASRKPSCFQKSTGMPSPSALPSKVPYKRSPYVILCTHYVCTVYTLCRYSLNAENCPQHFKWFPCSTNLKKEKQSWKKSGSLTSDYTIKLQ